MKKERFGFSKVSQGEGRQMSNLKNPTFWAQGVFFAYYTFLFLFLALIVPSDPVGKGILFVFVLWPIIAFIRSIRQPISTETNYRNSIIVGSTLMVIIGTIGSSFLVMNFQRWHQIVSWNHGFLVFLASPLPFGLLSLIILACGKSK
jgi:hypothetical protein